MAVAQAHVMIMLRFYALIIGCIFVRKIAWFRNGCLSIFLLLTAIAAVHSIVLAAVHTNGKSLIPRQDWLLTIMIQAQWIWISMRHFSFAPWVS